MYPFFESIAIKDGHILNLDEHQLRMDKTFKQYYPDYPVHNLMHIDFSSMTNYVEIVKLKVKYNHSAFLITKSTYHKAIFTKFHLYHLQLFDYQYKYSDRILFEYLKGKLNTDEEYIFVLNNEITDTSYANICFYDECNWYTPVRTLLAGTMRNALLNNKTIKLKRIILRDIYNFSKFKIINALNDFETTPEYPISFIGNHND